MCRYAHDALTSFMSSHGFKVTEHFVEIETAWKAEYEYGRGGRVLGVNSEMDGMFPTLRLYLSDISLNSFRPALPGIGHACGHNLIAIAGVGIALGLKAALEKHDIPGKIILLGTPGTLAQAPPS